MNYDVLVLGGGFTGCCAALAAARRGSKVLLVEACGFLGGAAANQLVFPFMPWRTKVEDKPFSLVRGIFEELLEEQKKVFYADPAKAGLPQWGSGVDGNGTPETETTKILLDQKMQEAGVEVLFHATLCGVKKEGASIQSISVATKAGVLELAAKVFIDTTGDADLCAYAKVPTVHGRKPDGLCQPMTLCFRVGNIDRKKFWEQGCELAQEMYKKLQASGEITNPRENLLIFHYPIEGILHFNTTRVVKLDPVDPFAVSRAEMMARKQVLELMNLFHHYRIPGMENARLLMTAAQIGVRESRMLDGAYTLTGKDLVDCTKFPDAIAAGNYDIDIHNPEGAGTSHYYFKDGTWYTIPYRALTPRAADAENLLVAGRCFSCDHEAQASVRIMPICCATGEAAGAAAALAAQNGTTVQNVPVDTLRATLLEKGAFIG